MCDEEITSKYLIAFMKVIKECSDLNYEEMMEIVDDVYSGESEEH